MELKEGREGSFPALPFFAVFLSLGLILSAAGCVPLCRSRAPGERMVRTELYFGFSRPGGGAVTEAEWLDFLEREVTPRFPAGLTVLDGRGQWRNAKGETVREQSRVLVLFHAGGADEGRKLEEIRGSWKEKFGQESVLRATSPAKVSF